MTVIVLFRLDAIKSYISRAKKFTEISLVRKFTENYVFKWTYLSHFVIISAGAAPVPRFATRPKGLSTLELEELR